MSSWFIFKYLFYSPSGFSRFLQESAFLLLKISIVFDDWVYAFLFLLPTCMASSSGHFDFCRIMLYFSRLLFSRRWSAQYVVNHVYYYFGLTSLLQIPIFYFKVRRRPRIVFISVLGLLMRNTLQENLSANLDILFLQIQNQVISCVVASSLSLDIFCASGVVLARVNWQPSHFLFYMSFFCPSTWWNVQPESLAWIWWEVWAKWVFLI